MPVGAALGAAAIGAGATVYASNKATKANTAAVNTQAAAANAAIANNNTAVDKATGLITGAYNSSKDATSAVAGSYDPWRQVGLSALASLASVHGFQLPDELKALAPGGAMGGFFESPDYKYRVEQGTKAITAQAASRGLLDSGATGKALVRFGQQEASSEFGRWYDRLTGVANMGFAANQARNQGLIAGAEADLRYGTTIADLTVGNAGRNNQINLNQAGVAAGGIANNGLINANTAGALGGIGFGLIQNWPQQQPKTLQQMGVTTSDYFGGLIPQVGKDYRLGVGR